LNSDEQLVEAAIEGSAEAFTELVERYQQRLLRFLVTRSASRAHAEDALQDTLINAYRYLHSYDPRWRFSTWLYRIAIRNATRQAALPQVGPDELCGETDLLRECIADSERENLWLTAKKLLSGDAYSAMWLRYVEDLAMKDIARTLDRSLSWTKVSLMRSRRRLQTELKQEGVAESRGEMYG
jgi:RNA polymerase sigma-70 factor (ECF subfamily)